MQFWDHVLVHVHYVWILKIYLHVHVHVLQCKCCGGSRFSSHAYGSLQMRSCIFMISSSTM